MALVSWRARIVYCCKRVFQRRDSTYIYAWFWLVWGGEAIYFQESPHNTLVPLMPQQITVILHYSLAQCIQNNRAYACTFFSSVTGPRHWYPGQLQKHITGPVCSLPKPNSHIPRFPQPGSPNQSWISVSRFHMTDGYSWESSLWLFSFITMSLSFLKADVFERICSLSLSLFLCFIHRKQLKQA